jgi:hypothetical protein
MVVGIILQLLLQLIQVCTCVRFKRGLLQSDRNGNYDIWVYQFDTPPPSPTLVGYNPAWLAITLMSLMVAGGYLLRRRMA